MSRPSMAGRKLIVEVAHEPLAVTTDSKSPKARLLEQLSPTTVKLEGMPLNKSPPSIAKSPLGSIPPAMRALHAEGEVVTGEERQRLQSPHGRAEEKSARDDNTETDEKKTPRDGDPLRARAVCDLDLDFAERSSSKQLNSSVQQRVGAAFFSSLAFKRGAELAKFPVVDALGRAVIAQEAIDLQMILDELGAEGPLKVAARDRYGRTALHLAAMGDSARVVSCLLESFRRQTYRQLQEDVLKLDNDRFSVMAELNNKASGGGGGGRGGGGGDTMDKHPRLAVVQEWFQRELARKHRQAEIRIEVWWAKLLSTRDSFGRTPLHCAVGADAPVKVLEALLTSGRSQSRSSSSVLLGGLPIFNKLCVYDSTSGLEIVSLVGAGGENNASAGVREIAWELGSTLGSVAISAPTAESAAAESFEVVVPWVLRNVVRRAVEQQQQQKGPRGSNSTHAGLEALDALVKASVSKPSSILLVPELRALLSLLGIRVTNEVLREMCRRYPADINEVRNKWIRVEEEQQDEARDIKKAAALLEKRRHGSRGDKDHDAAAEDKSFSSYGGRRSGSKGDDDAQHRRSREHEAGAKETDEEKGSGRGKRVGQEALEADERGSRAIRERASKLLLMDAVDSERGVDFHLLFADLKDGRGLQSLDMRSMRVTGSDGEKKRGDDELDQLLGDGDGDGESKRGRAVSGADAEQALQHEPAYSACVSIASIARARRAVANVCDDFGRSPLLIASALGQSSYVACLLSHGGDVSLSTPDGHSALSLASGGSSTRSLLEKALVTWLNKKAGEGVGGGGGGGGAEKRLVEIKRDDSFLESLRHSRLDGGGGAAGFQPRVNVSESAHRQAAARLEERSHVVMGLTSQLQQLSLKNWSYSRSPLSWAVNNGLLAVVEQLLSDGTSPNGKDTVNRTALHECAALVGDASSATHLEASLKIAEALAGAGADVNAASVSGRRPLHELFCRGQDEAASSFARVQHGKRGKALFHVVGTASSPALVRNYRRMLLKVLLEFGADPAALDRQGMAPMHYCARENDAGCMLELLRRHHNPATLTAQRQTCLHIACKAGAQEVVQMLCRWDADSKPGHGLLHQRDAQGKSALTLLPSSTPRSCTETLWGAARLGNVNKCQDLLSTMSMSGDGLWDEVDEVEGTDATQGSSNDSSISSRDGLEPGHYSGSSAQELWLLPGVDAKTRRMRWSPLHACIAGWAEMESSGPGKVNLSARRALGLPSVSVSGPGSPPRSVGVAGAGLFAETLALLLQNHAFVDSIDCNGRTPLMLAAGANLTTAVGMLVQAFGDVEHRDLDGACAMHIAYAYGSAASVSLLETWGVNSEARDGSGRTPLDCAGRMTSPLFG